jgi:hypothetical protein
MNTVQMYVIAKAETRILSIGVEISVDAMIMTISKGLNGRGVD